MQGADISKFLSSILSTNPNSTTSHRTLTGHELVNMLTAAVNVCNQPGGVMDPGYLGKAMMGAQLKTAGSAAHGVYEKKTRKLASCMKAEKAQKMHQVGCYVTLAWFISVACNSTMICICHVICLVCCLCSSDSLGAWNIAVHIGAMMLVCLLQITAAGAVHA